MGYLEEDEFITLVKPSIVARQHNLSCGDHYQDYMGVCMVDLQ